MPTLRFMVSYDRRVPARVGVGRHAVAEPPVGGEPVEGQAQLLHRGGGDPRWRDGGGGGRFGFVRVLHGERGEIGRAHV